MPDPAKFDLSERDICTKFITPAVEQAGWLQSQFREGVKLTDGRVMVHGNVATRIKDSEVKGGPKRADYVFYAKPNLALAVMETKRNSFSLGKGMPQALDYAEMLDAPFGITLALVTIKACRCWVDLDAPPFPRPRMMPSKRNGKSIPTGPQPASRRLRFLAVMVMRLETTSISF
jgi:type I site-specific restriction endonuclease